MFYIFYAQTCVESMAYSDVQIMQRIGEANLPYSLFTQIYNRISESKMKK